MVKIMIELNDKNDIDINKLSIEELDTLVDIRLDYHLRESRKLKRID